MELTATWWQALIAIVGGFGGLEFIKWLFNRKTNTRIAIAAAESAEFHTLQETVQFLQTQLREKEERFANQTDRLRRTQDDLFKEREARHRAELELALRRCDEDDCPFRQPPNAYTPPRPGLTIEQYHATRTGLTIDQYHATRTGHT